VTAKELGNILGNLKARGVRDLTMGSCDWEEGPLKDLSNRVGVPVGARSGGLHYTGHVRAGKDKQGRYIVDVASYYQDAEYRALPSKDPYMVPLSETPTFRGSPNPVRDSPGDTFGEPP